MLRKLWLVTLLVSIISATNLITPATAQGTGWTAEYFNNASLTGAPVLVRTETTPTNEWGYGSPGPGVPADYFSARWSTTAYLNAGTYNISVKADDGVRVSVNGVVYINEWHAATGNLYQTTLTLAAGNHSFVVEYYEATEIAALAYNFNLIGQQPVPSAPQAQVIAQFLNVRALPNPTAALMQVISQHQTYPVVGRNSNNTWLQLNINGTLGWVNTSYVNATNISGVPVTDGQGGGILPTAIPTPLTAQVTAYLLNVRSTPDPFADNVILQIRQHEVYPVVGRNLDTSWLQLNINGTPGWVRSSWMNAANAASAPVTSNTNDPSRPAPEPQAQATVRAYFLNVRQYPYYGAPVLSLISSGQTYPVVARNSDSSWVQINVGGTIGWVRSSWVIINPNLTNVPITA